MTPLIDRLASFLALSFTSDASLRIIAPGQSRARPRHQSFKTTTRALDGLHTHCIHILKRKEKKREKNKKNTEQN